MTKTEKAVAWTVAAAATAALMLSGPEPALRSYPEPTTTSACYEDEACWDCATMGNLVCGGEVRP